MKIFSLGKKQLNTAKIILSTFLVFSILISLVPTTAWAYDRADYSALLTSLSDGASFTMAPGEFRQIHTQWQNIGSAPWVQSGHAYISLYTYDPKYRHSVFDPGTWMGPTQLRLMEQTRVQPGEVADIYFDLHAPQEPGVYTETFHMAAEDKAWVEGGEVTFTIQVEDPAAEIVEEVQEAPVIPFVSEEEGYEAKLIILSKNEVEATAGKTFLMTALFENTGTKTWNNYGFVLPDVQLASGSVSFAASTWTDSHMAYVPSTSVPPGGTALIDFSLKAPQTNGIYDIPLQFEANGIEIEEAEIILPVTVTGGAGEIVRHELLQPEISYETEEPLIRVGVLIVDEETDDKVVVTSNVSDFDLKDTEGNLLGELKKGQQVVAYYSVSESAYFYDTGRGLEMSSYGLRFEPKEEYAPMIISNFDRRVTRDDYYAYNSFRGVLELRYNDYKERTWMVNELPFEMYLRGLAETSNYHPMEFQKAQITAARTYAYYHVLRDGKRTSEYIDLASSSADQVYKGYEREMQAPRIVEAVDETRGVMVTYEGEVAITPYFARSNGYTKDWSDVWWGEQPHVQGVVVPCDAGKTQWGHGVGMPQSGGICMAEGGSTWEEILSYFYTDIELIPWWK